MSEHLRKAVAAIAAAAVLGAALAAPALACTRTLYVGDDGMVVTGRNMDWKEDMSSNIWVFPVGMVRDGAAVPTATEPPSGGC